MKTKDIQELYQTKLHSMDTILHQISLMDRVENEQELSEIIHSLLQAIPVSLMPNWVKRFENKEVIVIDDLETTKYSNRKNMNY